MRIDLFKLKSIKVDIGIREVSFNIQHRLSSYKWFGVDKHGRYASLIKLSRKSIIKNYQKLNSIES